MQALTLSEYNALPDKDRLNWLEQEGVVIGRRFTGKYHVYLHQLFSFYVELHYHKKKTYLLHITTFDSIDKLQPYIKEISLDELDL
jgi:hypothetical protein